MASLSSSVLRMNSGIWFFPKENILCKYRLSTFGLDSACSNNKSLRFRACLSIMKSSMHSFPPNLNKKMKKYSVNASSDQSKSNGTSSTPTDNSTDIFKSTVIKSNGSSTPTDIFESTFNESNLKSNENLNQKSNEIKSQEPLDVISPPAFFWLNNILAGIGIADTAYLTYEKWTGGSVYCPLNGSCNEVLNSAYGSVFGIPLSLFGLLAYSSVPILTFLSQSQKKSNSSTDFKLESVAKWSLLLLTSGMTSASAYFTYIMLFELHDFCLYCILSAFLSSSLLFSSFKSFSQSERIKVFVPQIGVVLSTILSLSLFFSNARFALAGVSDYFLPYSQPKIETISSLPAVDLAKHLNEIGAKMYGAFWCSHCNEQKRAFGEEATKYLNYVECFPSGFSYNLKMDKNCLDANIEGFPTWVINNQVLPGEQDLDYLAEISGFYDKYD